MQVVAQGILRTLVWFDQFDYPLTGDEAWRWWYGSGEPPPSRDAFDRALGELESSRRLVRSDGFFALPGRQGIVSTRRERAERNRIKWQRAERAARLVQWLPFVRFFGVCNTVAISNGKPESDVDVFVVARRNRLWLTRFLVTAAVSLLGIRRAGSSVADRVCLSFFVTDAALDFRPLLLEPADPYFAFWVDQLVPLYDPDNLLAAIRQQNGWVKSILPNAFSVTPRPRVFSIRAAVVRRPWEFLLGGFLGNWLELGERALQQGKMKHAPNPAATGASVITDDVLKFHEVDRREEYCRRFEERLASLR